jgi:hypothetical protein
MAVGVIDDADHPDAEPRPEELDPLALAGEPWALVVVLVM